MDDLLEPVPVGQPGPLEDLPSPWEERIPAERPGPSPDPVTSQGASFQAAQPPPADIPDQVFRSMEEAVREGFAEVLREFRDKFALDRFKEDQITKLHEEVQAFRNDLVLRTVRQVLQGLIRLHDDLGKVSASIRQRSAEEMTLERFLQQLAGFQDDVELLLGQHGVERFEGSGEGFDPRRQTALRMVFTDDPAQVGRIAERLRPGFEQGESLLQKERVAVFAAANGTNEKA